MMRLATALGVSTVVLSGAAFGQQCANGFRPVNNTGNFLSAPAQLPRRTMGLWRESVPHPSEGRVITPTHGFGRQGVGRGFVSTGRVGGPIGSEGGGPRQCFEGSGLNIRGQISSGDATVALSLNSGVLGSCDVGNFDHPLKDCGFSHGVCSPVVSPWWWGTQWWYDYYEPRYPIDGPVVVYQTSLPAQGQAAPPSAPAPVDLTDAQQAALLLKSGDTPQAIALLESYLNSEPDDAEAMRLLALALVSNGQVREAAAMMSFAYGADRSLAHEPLGPSNLAAGSRGLREAVRESVAFAHEEESSSAWLLVSVLMQAEGRDNVALRMLERSIDAGLDERVGIAMRAALGG